MEKLPRSFFERPPEIVAKELLGHIFVHQTEQETVKGIIVETEAYGDMNDLASHARFGITERNKIMYGPAGILYVYLNYGIFNLTNIICNQEGKAGAILIRAAQITEGFDLVTTHLNTSRFVKNNELMATGPGKLSVAFNIDRSHNETDIVTSNEIFVEKNSFNFDIIETPRVGVDYAGECKNWHWRFYIKDNKFVSKIK